MLIGKQTWSFPNAPVVLAGATVVGRMEGEGPLKSEFDRIHEDAWLGQETFEKAEQSLLEEAGRTAITKANLMPSDIDLFIAGDLMNQITSSSFTARGLNLPYLGLFGACSTSMESLALAAQIVSCGFAKKVLAATVSHNNTAEKQFRNPNEYGAQRPPTAQWTVTGAGAAVVADVGEGPKIRAATIGKVVDMGCTDPFDMGAAMAPAAVDAICRHLQDRNIQPQYFDLIVTGDLGEVGHKIAKTLLADKGITIEQTKFNDCGLIIFDREKQDVFAGGSGCGCCASVTYGYLLNQLQKGLLNKILVVATGALMSPLTYQQSESIPGIAYAVALERS